MIVWVWTAVAVIGALFAAWNTYDAWLDLRALGPLQNGRRIIARGWVRRELFRFFIQSVWALIGVWTLPRANGEVNVVAVLLVLTNMAVAANTVLDAKDRIALRRIIGP